MTFANVTVGFIGLGTMGFPMAQNLAQKLPSTTHIYVFDISQATVDKLSLLSQETVHGCSSAKEVADKSNIIISMVPEGGHVRSVYLAPETGVLASTTLRDKISIDCSTIDTETSKLVLDELKAIEPTASFYDAPVSGGSLGAARATLTFMLGCAEEDPNFATLQSLLGLMGTSIFACGGPLLGLQAKLCNNYCSGLIAIATSEALNLGMRSGLRPDVLAKIFSKGTAQSTINDKWNPVPGISPEAPASHKYEGGFKVELMRKDFALAVQSAERVNAKLTLGDAGLKVYTDASNDPNCRGRDSRVVFRFIGGDENWR